jgi:hypothetical protein
MLGGSSVGLVKIILPIYLENGLREWKRKKRHEIRVGVCALLWAIWHVHNDYIFNKGKPNSFMQVIPLATH